ncbi:extracellular solute-binding protein [Streptomyces sp. NPDC058773]|uniref:extracellular solute-binding protein n=1 Tax=Streptomyces sp. NPDC058773 TaxID=3346632 RepID=UPI003682E3EA
MTRPPRAAALAALTLALATSGCTADGQLVPEKGAIVLATGSDLSSSGVRQELIHAWERRTGRTVRIVKLPDTADGQRSQLLAAGQSGNGGYDVLNLDVAWTAEFAEAGVIRPWATSLDGDFLDSVAKTVQYDGKVWGVPFNTDAGLLYYRKDILRRYHRGAPSTWSELREAATEVAAAHNREAAREAAREHRKKPPTMYGMVAQLRPYEGLTVNTLESAWGNGGDPDATSFTKGGQIGALQQGIADLKLRLDSIMPHEATTMDETESRRWFADGRALFMRNWPVAYASVAEKLRPGREFEITQLPARADGKRLSVLGGQNLAISAHSTRPEGARSLIEALTGPGSERCLLERGFAATRDSAYRQAATAPHCPLPPGGAERGEHGAPGRPEPRPDPGTLHEALLAAAPRPRSAHYQTFSKVVQLGVSAYLNGRGSTAIADRLAREADDALGGRGEQRTRRPADDG